MFKSVLRTKTTVQSSIFDSIDEAIDYVNAFVNGCQEKEAICINDKNPYGIIFENGQYIKIHFYQN